jgi:aromatic-amino-acid transaminase
MSLVDITAQGKGGPDAILTYSGAAKARIAQIGQEAVTNATIGCFMDEAGKLKTMKAVEEAMKAVPYDLACSYGPTEGVRGYIDALIDNVLRDHRPQGTFIDGVVSPGGTGALHNAMINYTGVGDIAITTDYCWGNYVKMLHEIGRRYITFKTFTDDGAFNVDGCLDLCRTTARTQRNVALILNTPSQNPTGLAVALDEWDRLLAGLSDIANNGSNNVILMVDTAYIDYSPADARCFFEKFADLPANLLVLVAASASKGYTLYGYRLGLLFCIAQTAQDRDDFVRVCKSSTRATWSSCNNAGMEAIAAIAADPAKLAALRSEQEEFRAELAARADLFSQEAKDCGLKILPFVSGFFIYVPLPTHEVAVKVYEELTKKEIYVVPLGSGLRVAICSVGLNKIPGMAGAIKEACNTVLG